MLDELGQFLLIADHGTFTEAARRAHLSQPALTAAMHRLEEHMGAPLFHRGRGGTRLTAAGEALVPRARAALAAVREGKRAVAEVQGLAAGEVRVGAGATVCTYFLPGVLTAFQKAYPSLILKLREGTSAQIEAAVDAGDLDLGLVTSPRAERWLVDELVFVGAPGADASKHPVVTFPPGASTRDALDRHIPDARIVMELSGIAAVKAFVRARVGVALISRTAVTGELARGTLVELPHRLTPIRRPIGILHRGLDRLPPAAAALRARLLDLGPDHLPGGARPDRRPRRSQGREG